MGINDKNFDERNKKARLAELRFIEKFTNKDWFIIEYGIHMEEKDNDKFWGLPKIIQKTPDFICWKPEDKKNPIFVEHKTCGKHWLALKHEQHIEYKRWNTLMPVWYAIEIQFWDSDGSIKYADVLIDWNSMEKLAQQSLTANDGKMQPFPNNTNGSKVHYPILTNTIISIMR